MQGGDDAPAPSLAPGTPGRCPYSPASSFINCLGKINPISLNSFKTPQRRSAQLCSNRSGDKPGTRKLGWIPSATAAGEEPGAAEGWRGRGLAALPGEGASKGAAFRKGREHHKTCTKRSTTTCLTAPCPQTHTKGRFPGVQGQEPRHPLDPAGAETGVPLSAPARAQGVDPQKDPSHSPAEQTHTGFPWFQCCGFVLGMFLCVYLNQCVQITTTRPVFLLFHKQKSFD